MRQPFKKMRLSFRKMLYLGLVVASCAVVAMALTGLYHEHKEDEYNLRLDAFGATQRHVAKMKETALTIRQDVLSHVIVSDGQEMRGLQTEILKQEKELVSKMDMPEVLLLSEPEKKALQNLREAWAVYRDARDTRVLPVSAAKRKSDAYEAATSGAGGTGFRNVMKAFAELEKAVEERGAAELSSVTETERLFRQIIWLGMGGMVFLFLLISMGLTSRVTKGIQEAVLAAEAMSKGDLTRKIPPDGDEDLGKLGEALNRMEDDLEAMIGEISQSSYALSHGAGEMFRGNENFASNLTLQAAMVEEITATIEEMAEAVRRNAGSSDEANRHVSGVWQTAEGGSRVMEETFGTMKEISVSSRMTADIISVIDDIAFQTNLLALNAAVEAARAGDHGKGFAVVAQEVRNLAQRSSKAAKEVSGLVQENLKKTEKGALLADQSMAMTREIVDSVKKAAQLVSEIRAASQEQAHGIDQVRQAVIQLDEMTQNNASLYSETSSTAKDISDHSLHLCTLVSRFRIYDSSVGHCALGDSKPLKNAGSPLIAHATNTPSRRDSTERLSTLRSPENEPPAPLRGKMPFQGRSRAFEPPLDTKSEF